MRTRCTGRERKIDLQDPILIIGASGAIGSAIAQTLGESGRHLLLHGRRNNSKLRNLSRHLSAPSFTGDLSREDDARTFTASVIEKHPILSGIVFCMARPFPHRLALRTDWRVFQEQIDTQLKALHTTLQALKPTLEKRLNGGRVIVLSTEYVLGAPPQKIAPYIAAKAALTAYCRVLAQELLKAKIRVHILAPGMVRSALTADLPEQYLEMVEAEMPEAKMTTAKDVADVCAMLMSDAADPLYGTVIPVSRATRR